jgi:7-cyano-7-deazaguanine synthase
MKDKTVTVLFSGGIDSTSCIRFFSDRDYDVRALFVDYGQAASAAEAQAVETLKVLLNVPVTVVKASSDITFGAGALVGRNAFLIFSAIILGGCREGLLAIGAHAGTSYYDCSPTFIARINILVEECTNGRLSIVAPFIRWSKDDVYSFFSTLTLPLSHTYSCEEGSSPTCGRCASCKDRMRFECSPSVAL